MIATTPTPYVNPNEETLATSQTTIPSNDQISYQYGEGDMSGLGGQAALDTTLIGENAPMPEIPLDAQIAAYNQLLLEQEAAKQAAIQAAIENTTTVYEPRPPVVTVTPPPVNTTPPPVSTTTLPWTPPVASPPPVVTVTPPPPPPPQEDEYETGNVGDSGASHGGTGFTYSTPITNSGVSYYGL